MTCFPNGVSNFQITIHSPLQPAPLTIQVHSTLEKIGQALSGGHLPSIAKAVFSHSELREHILLKVMDVMNEQCDVICRKNPEKPSIFRKIAAENVNGFFWISAIQELQKKCLLLFQLFSSLVSRNDHRNNCKKGENHHAGLTMAIAANLKERRCVVSRHMWLLYFSIHGCKRR